MLVVHYPLLRAYTGNSISPPLQRLYRFEASAYPPNPRVEHQIHADRQATGHAHHSDDAIDGVSPECQRITCQFS